MGKIIDIVVANGFSIGRVMMLRLSEEMIHMMFSELASRPGFREFIRFMQSDVVVGMEVIGENSIERMKVIAGPESPTLARESSDIERMSIRAVFGTDSTKNTIHVSRDEPSYRRESEIFFNDRYIKDGGCMPAVLNNCSLCLIKPHAVQ